MVKILEYAKYFILIPVIAFLGASLVTFIWGALKMFTVTASIFSGTAENSVVALALLEMMDTFLIGTVLFIFSIGYYDLFIGKVNTPDWLVIDDLGKLKAKLSDVIVLFMAIKFLDKLLQSTNALETLLYAIGITVVSLALIALNRSRS
ncbi:MAG: YqhA family protein [Anaerolineales bacterium]|nr:YqhA family protein [Anaerolineales bacterium]NTW12498.1 YqhA family protein [Anaerolineales bacterium]